ncbi:MAG: FAD-dependent oxidoreductase [Pseudomonadota bacterium]
MAYTAGVTASNVSPSSSTELDALIIGGGVAGLWLLHKLTARGYDAALLSAGPLGEGQSLAAQGIIHSGLKYGQRTDRQALRDGLKTMPDRWRAALAGKPQPQDPDLMAVRVLSDGCYLFAGRSPLDRLRQRIAHRALAGEAARVEPSAWAAHFRGLGFAGEVVRLNEPVVDARSLIDALHALLASRCYQLRVEADALQIAATGVELTMPGHRIRATRLILAAGTGNAELLTALGPKTPPDRGVRRPLHQVVVHHPELPPLYGHCLTGARRAEPRLTITSHPRGDGASDWYLGGRLATTGSERDAAKQLAHARRELRACLPGFPWDRAEFTSVRVDRAEPAQRPGSRAAVFDEGPLIWGWPVKLTLAPDFADLVCEKLAASTAGTGARIPGEVGQRLPLPAAVAGQLTWQPS